MASKFAHQGELLRTYRTRKALPQSAVSRALHQCPQGASNIERGKCGIPLKHADALCTYLEIPREELIRAYMLDYRERLEVALGGNHE